TKLKKTKDKPEPVKAKRPRRASPPPFNKILKGWAPVKSNLPNSPLVSTSSTPLAKMQEKIVTIQESANVNGTSVYSDQPGCSREIKEEVKEEEFEDGYWDVRYKSGGVSDDKMNEHPIRSPAPLPTYSNGDLEQT
ncbi:hypothetical protein PMAYCL1PPCAC_31303, partial [Pristionchus mayeri]